MAIVPICLLFCLSGCHRRHYPFYGSPNIAGEMQSTCSVTENWMPKLPDSKRPYDDHWVVQYFTADFADSSDKQLFYAGLVTINGRALQFDTRHLSYHPTQNLDGANDTDVPRQWHWQVSGSSSVPLIDDSLTKPYGFRITNPRAIYDTVSKSKGFQIVYQNPGTDSVIIGIAYDSMRTYLLNTKHPFAHPSSGGFRGGVDTTVPNTGSFYIASNLLSQFANYGLIQIAVRAPGQTKIVEADGRKYRLSADCSARTFCFIKE